MPTSWKSDQHASCSITDGTDWIEPVRLWIAICKPTGSGKSSFCEYLKKLVDTAHSNCGLDDFSPSWYLDDQSFEKMGAMSDNHCKLLGLYNELTMFLSQINVFGGRGLADSHELSIPSAAWWKLLGEKNRYVYLYILGN